MVHIFIVNPVCAGTGYSNSLREELSQIPGLNYYVFSIRSDGYETELARIIEHTFEGEQLRIYCCGGAGTARNIMNGLSDLSRVEIGLVPLGEIDYLDAFDNRERFLNIKDMINGEIMHVDYLKVNDGVALGMIAVGLDAYATKNLDSFRGFRAFGKSIPYLMTFIYTLIFAPNNNYVFQVGDKRGTRRCTQIAFGNVPIVGGKIRFSKDNDIQDGLASYLITGVAVSALRIPILLYLKKRKGNIRSGERNLEIGKADSMTIRRVGGYTMWCDIDGELESCTECRVEVVRQGLKLVVPRGVANEQ